MINRRELFGLVVGSAAMAAAPEKLRGGWRRPIGGLYSGRHLYLGPDFLVPASWSLDVAKENGTGLDWPVGFNHEAFLGGVKVKSCFSADEYGGWVICLAEANPGSSDNYILCKRNLDYYLKLPWIRSRELYWNFSGDNTLVYEVRRGKVEIRRREV